MIVPFLKKYKPLRYPDFFIDKMNFSVTWVHAKDNMYGALAPQTGKWNGLVEVLSNNDADMGLNYLAITPLRSKVIGYLIPFTTIKYKLFK